jgi:hypothetical protein
MLLHFSLLLIVLTAFQASAARIEGFEPDYAGRTIEFMTWTDPVSKNEAAAFTLRIGPQGRIQVETGIQEVLFCYAEFDSYRGKMVIIPGQTLKIKLPPLKEKTFEESKNPYFKPIELWIIGQEGGQEDLSTRFARFDQRFYSLQDKYFNQLFYRQQRQYLDSMRIPLDTEFGRIRQQEFQWHQRLMIMTTEAGIMRTGREKLLGSLKELPPSAWRLPAFADLTDRLLTNTLSQESKSAQGAKLRSVVSQQKLAELKNWTENLTGTVSPMSDLLLLKILHDAFYSGEFPKNAILQMLQQKHFSGHPVREVRHAAAEVHSKLQFLHTGTQAPVICLPSLTGDTVCSTSNAKPFQYILFADLEIPVCREQVKYLTEIYERIGEHAEFLLILSPSEKIDNLEFVTSNRIPGRIVSDDYTRMTGRKYKIRAYPSALLINRDHKVVLSPAKTPLDGFELQLQGIIPK